MKALLLFAVLGIASPAVAQTKYTKATVVPPPGHNCQDLYRSRDDASRYGALYERSDATISQPMACEASLNKPPEIPTLPARVRPRY
jgi:hypothetical protein